MTVHDRQYLKKHRQDIAKEKQEEFKEMLLKKWEEVKDLFVMGINKRKAKGPNPLSIKRKKNMKIEKPKKRKWKGVWRKIKEE